RGVLHRWEARTGKALPVQATGQDQMWKTTVTADGRLALCGAIEQLANPLSRSGVVWDLARGRLACPPLRHQGSVHGLAFSPDGGTVVAGSYDQTTRAWRLADGRALGPPHRHSGKIGAVAFRPDGKAILTGSSDRFARLWEFPSWKPVGSPME